MKLLERCLIVIRKKLVALNTVDTLEALEGNTRSVCAQSNSSQASSTRIVCFLRALVSRWISGVFLSDACEPIDQRACSMSNQHQAHGSCVSFERLWAVESAVCFIWSPCEPLDQRCVLLLRGELLEQQKEWSGAGTLRKWALSCALLHGWGRRRPAAGTHEQIDRKNKREKINRKHKKEKINRKHKKEKIREKKTKAHWQRFYMSRA